MRIINHFIDDRRPELCHSLGSDLLSRLSNAAANPGKHIDPN
jgi:hypothetical protein